MKNLPILELEICSTTDDALSALNLALKREPENTCLGFYGLAHGANVVSIDKTNKTLTIQPHFEDIQKDTHKAVLSWGMYGLKAGIYKNEDVGNILEPKVPTH